MFAISLSAHVAITDRVSKNSQILITRLSLGKSTPSAPAADPMIQQKIIKIISNIPKTRNVTISLISFSNMTTSTTQTGDISPDDNFIAGATVPYLIAGSISVPLCLFVIYTFARYKKLRKHPAGLLLGRTIADLGFVLSVVSLSIITDWMEYEVLGQPDATSKLTETCNQWGVLTIFFLNTSQFYFIGMCYDLYAALRFPLRSQSYTAKQVHAVSWICGFIVAITCWIYNAVSKDLSLVSYNDQNEICFFDRSSLSLRAEPLVVFGVPYLLGVLSGIASLIMVVIRLRNGLSDIFAHAKRVVHEHIFAVLLYVCLGVIWWSLLLIPTVGTNVVPLIVMIVIGIPMVDAVSWLLTKFRTPFHRFKHLRSERSALFSLLRTRSISTLNRKQEDYIELATLQQDGFREEEEEQSISNALRMELIRAICGGIADSVSSVHKHCELLDNPDAVNPLHFAPAEVVDTVKGSDEDRDWTVNGCIQRLPPRWSRMDGGGSGEEYEFTEYSPLVFRFLRNAIYGLNDYEFVESVALDNSAELDAVSAKFSEGRSGSFFFETPNNEFVIKTVTKSEIKTFLKILPGYFEHIRKYDASLLVRFLGIYSVTMYGATVYFVAMKNIFTPQLAPHEKYDIKGSWRNRRTDHHLEEGRLMKDEDLHKKVLMDPNHSESVWQQLSADTRFLTNLGIMDYSLLLGMYYVGVESAEALGDRPARWQIAKGFVHQNHHQNDHGTIHINTENKGSADFLLRGSAEWTTLKSSIWTDPQHDSMNRTMEFDEDGVELAVNVDSVSVDHSNEDREDTEVTGQWTPAVRESNEEESEDRKLLQPQQSFLRRRAFTSSSGLQQVSNTDNTYSARIIEGPGYYSLGIIDILQEWDWNKKMERWLKIYFRCEDPYGISCIEPTLYRKRFLAKMLQIGIGRKNARV